MILKFVQRLAGMPTGERNRVFDILFSFLVTFNYLWRMVIISKRKLIEFYDQEPKAKEPLLKWYHQTEMGDWNNLSEIKETFNTAEYVGNDRYVFNIGGNKYRLVSMIHFSTRTLYIRFTGTHKQYDKIDCKTI